MTLNISKMIR